MVIAGALLAFAIGGVLGAFGGGGSLLLVPLLSWLFGLPAHAAVATSLVVVGIASAVALVHRRRDVRWRHGLAFGALSMVAAVGGTRLRQLLPSEVVTIGFGLLLFAAGVAMIRPPAWRVRRASPVAIAVGVLTGMFGAAGGFVIVPALRLGGLPARAAVATTFLVIVMNAIAGFAASPGGDLSLALVLTPCVVAGSFAGARWRHP